MKKLWLILLLIVVVGALIFGGCAKPAPAPAPAPQGPQEILIGSPVSLTGMYAGFGQGGIFGEQAAVDDINKLGGVYVAEFGRKIPLKLIIADSESDPIKAGTLAEDMILRDKIHFLVPPMEPPPMRSPIAIIADRYKIPQITGHGPVEPWLGMRMEVDPPWQYTWTTSFHIGMPYPEGDFRNGKLGYTIFDTWMTMLDQFGDQTNKVAGVFASDDPDGVGWYGLFPTALEEAGYTVIGVDKKLGLTPFGTTDYTSVINEWKANDVQILWGNSPSPHFAPIWRQSKQLGFQPKMVGAARAALYYVDVVSWGGDLPNGVGIEIWWDPSYRDSPGIGDTTPRSLAARWTAATGEPVNPAIGWSYPHIQILVDAIERAGTLDAEAVNKAIGETDIMGINHRVVFDPETHASAVPLSYGQWFKTDTPDKWELKIIYSSHDFLDVSAEAVFPIPYD